MKFFDQMLQVAADETARGNIVLAPFSVVAPEHQDSEFKRMLDELHRKKIDMSDSVIIVTNQHGYIGTSTRNEMVYAAQQGKPWDIREFHLSEPTPNKYGGPA
jgi:nucleoside 2-deoxyribosyltransferase